MIICSALFLRRFDPCVIPGTRFSFDTSILQDLANSSLADSPVRVASSRGVQLNLPPPHACTTYRIRPGPVQNLQPVATPRMEHEPMPPAVLTNRPRTRSANGRTRSACPCLTRQPDPRFLARSIACKLGSPSRAVSTTASKRRTFALNRDHQQAPAILQPDFNARSRPLRRAASVSCTF